MASSLPHNCLSVCSFLKSSLLFMLMTPGTSLWFSSKESDQSIVLPKAVARQPVHGSKAKVFRFIETKTKDADFFLKAHAYIDTERSHTTCRSDAVNAVLNSCNSADIPLSQLETTKSVYGARLAICQAEEARLPIPQQCHGIMKISLTDINSGTETFDPTDHSAWFQSFKDNDLVPCLKALEKTGTLWTSFESGRNNGELVCQAVRTTIEKDQVVETYRNMVDVSQQTARALMKATKYHEDQRAALAEMMEMTLKSWQDKIDTAARTGELKIYSLIDLTGSLTSGLHGTREEITNLHESVRRVYTPLVDGAMELADQQNRTYKLQQEAYGLGAENLNLLELASTKLAGLTESATVLQNWNSAVYGVALFSLLAFNTGVIISSSWVFVTYRPMPLYLAIPVELALGLFLVVDCCVLYMMFHEWIAHSLRSCMSVWSGATNQFDLVLETLSLSSIRAGSQFLCALDYIVHVLGKACSSAQDWVVTHPLLSTAIAFLLSSAFATWYLLEQRAIELAHAEQSAALARSRANLEYMEKTLHQRSKFPKMKMDRHTRASTSPPLSSKTSPIYLSVHQRDLVPHP